MKLIYIIGSLSTIPIASFKDEEVREIQAKICPSPSEIYPHSQKLSKNSDFNRRKAEFDRKYEEYFNFDMDTIRARSEQLIRDLTNTFLPLITEELEVLLILITPAFNLRSENAFKLVNQENSIEQYKQRYNDVDYIKVDQLSSSVDSDQDNRTSISSSTKRLEKEHNEPNILRQLMSSCNSMLQTLLTLLNSEKSRSLSFGLDKVATLNISAWEWMNELKVQLKVLTLALEKCINVCDADIKKWGSGLRNEILQFIAGLEKFNIFKDYNADIKQAREGTPASNQSANNRSENCRKSPFDANNCSQQLSAPINHDRSFAYNNKTDQDNRSLEKIESECMEHSENFLTRQNTTEPTPVSNSDHHSMISDGLQSLTPKLDRIQNNNRCSESKYTSVRSTEGINKDREKECIDKSINGMIEKSRNGLNNLKSKENIAESKKFQGKLEETCLHNSEYVSNKNISDFKENYRKRKLHHNTHDSRINGENNENFCKKQKLFRENFNDEYNSLSHDDSVRAINHIPHNGENQVNLITSVGQNNTEIFPVKNTESGTQAEGCRLSYQEVNPSTLKIMNDIAEAENYVSEYVDNETTNDIFNSVNKEQVDIAQPNANETFDNTENDLTLQQTIEFSSEGNQDHYSMISNDQQSSRSAMDYTQNNVQCSGEESACKYVSEEEDEFRKKFDLKGKRDHNLLDSQQNRDGYTCINIYMKKFPNEELNDESRPVSQEDYVREDKHLFPSFDSGIDLTMNSGPNNNTKISSSTNRESVAQDEGFRLPSQDVNSSTYQSINAIVGSETCFFIYPKTKAMYDNFNSTNVEEDNLTELIDSETSDEVFLDVHSESDAEVAEIHSTSVVENFEEVSGNSLRSSANSQMNLDSLKFEDTSEQKFEENNNNNEPCVKIPQQNISQTMLQFALQSSIAYRPSNITGRSIWPGQYRKVYDEILSSDESSSLTTEGSTTSNSNDSDEDFKSGSGESEDPDATSSTTDHQQQQSVVQQSIRSEACRSTRLHPKKKKSGNKDDSFSSSTSDDDSDSPKSRNRSSNRFHPRSAKRRKKKTNFFTMAKCKELQRKILDYSRNNDNFVTEISIDMDEVNIVYLTSGPEKNGDKIKNELMNILQLEERQIKLLGSEKSSCLKRTSEEYPGQRGETRSWTTVGAYMSVKYTDNNQVNHKPDYILTCGHDKIEGGHFASEYNPSECTIYGKIQFAIFLDNDIKCESMDFALVSPYGSRHIRPFVVGTYRVDGVKREVKIFIRSELKFNKERTEKKFINGGKRVQTYEDNPVKGIVKSFSFTLDDKSNKFCRPIYNALQVTTPDGQHAIHGPGDSGMLITTATDINKIKKKKFSDGRVEYYTFVKAVGVLVANYFENEIKGQPAKYSLALRADETIEHLLEYMKRTLQNDRCPSALKFFVPEEFCPGTKIVHLAFVTSGCSILPSSKKSSQLQDYCLCETD